MKLEAERYRRQKQTDLSKTSLERNKFGQFSTPFSLAREISRYTLSLLSKKTSTRMLEPAAGSGVFISSLVSLGCRNLEYTCVELDEAYARICEELFADFNCQVSLADFFTLLVKKDGLGYFDLLITNPPYVRHHHIESDTKKQYQAQVKASLGIQVSGLAGLYIYYILLSDKLLADGAIASWLIPSEFLYVNYGRALRQYLQERVSLIRIHRFEPRDVQFDDALVSSCIITYKKLPPDAGSSFGITKGSYQKPNVLREIPRDSIHHAEKWNFFASSEAGDDQGVPLEEFFHVTRGLATGNNSFFILDSEQVAGKQIPAGVLIPILPGPRDISSSVIEGKPSGIPVLKKQRFLLSTTLRPEEIQKKYPRLQDYLQEGENAGVHKGYLCRSRKLWYLQERREPPLFLATYMGRKRSDNSSPIRFFLNRSQAVATNVFICLYPRPELQRLLRENKKREIELLELLNSISKEHIENAGRQYGGGLQKMEPKELRAVKLQHLPEWLRYEKVEQIEMVQFDWQGMTKK